MKRIKRFEPLNDIQIYSTRKVQKKVSCLKLKELPTFNVKLIGTYVVKYIISGYIKSI